MQKTKQLPKRIRRMLINTHISAIILAATSKSDSAAKYNEFDLQQVEEDLAINISILYLSGAVTHDDIRRSIFEFQAVFGAQAAEELDSALRIATSKMEVLLQSHYNWKSAQTDIEEELANALPQKD